jgi:hypothetical protein
MLKGHTLFFCPHGDANWPAAEETAGWLSYERWWQSQRAAAAFGLAAGYTRRDVEVAFRRLACNAHPDMGGSDEAFQTLVEQRDLLFSHAAV